MSSEPSWQGVSSKTAKRRFAQGFVSRELLSFNRWDQSPSTKQISNWIFLPGRYCRSVGIFCRVRRWLCGRMTRGKWDDSLESRWLGRNSEVCRRQSALVQPQGRCALETWNAKKLVTEKQCEWSGEARAYFKQTKKTPQTPLLQSKHFVTMFGDYDWPVKIILGRFSFVNLQRIRWGSRRWSWRRRSRRTSAWGPGRWGIRLLIPTTFQYQQHANTNNNNTQTL